MTFAGKEFDVPFIVCGDGGHNVNPLVRAKKGQKPDEPQNGMSVKYLEAHPVLKVKDLLLEKYDDTNYGICASTLTRSNCGSASTRSARARWRNHATT